MPLRVAVRIDQSEITKETVEQWMSVMAPEHIVPDPPRYTACIARQEALVPGSIATVLEEECRQQYQEISQQALNFLISSQWLILGVAERGLKATGEEIQQWIRADRHLLNSGETAAEVRLTAESALALAGIHQALERSEPKITAGEIADYYRQNLQRYERRERRDINIIERLPSEAVARKVMSRVAPGASMAHAAIHESFESTNIAEVVLPKRAIINAIFAAKPHVFVGPTPLNGLWCFFEVSRVVPTVVQPLARVEGAIARQLAEQQQQRTLARFVRAWRRRWIARTSCSPGYVVQKCSQYRGVRTPEDPLSLEGSP